MKWLKITKQALFAGVLCLLLAQLAFAFTSHQVTVTRTFSVLEAIPQTPITITIVVDNNEPFDLNGFYFTEHVPAGLEVATVSVSVDGIEVPDVIVEADTENPIYSGYIPHRWIIENPSQEDQNLISAKGKLKIVYTVTSKTIGVRNFSEFSWVGYYKDAPSNDRALFGHSEDTDIKTIRFNTLPWISNIADQQVSKSKPILTLDFTIGDDDAETGELWVSGTSENQSIVPNCNITLTGSGPDRQATIEPSWDAAGTTTIILTVSDGIGEAQASFNLSVIIDECPQDPHKTTPGVCGCNVADKDTDKDDTPDCLDKDDDNDGVNDAEDAFPLDASESQDTDDDGVGDNADTAPHASIILGSDDTIVSGGGDRYVSGGRNRWQSTAYLCMGLWRRCRQPYREKPRQCNVCCPWHVHREIFSCRRGRGYWPRFNGYHC